MMDQTKYMLCFVVWALIAPALQAEDKMDLEEALLQTKTFHQKNLSQTQDQAQNTYYQVFYERVRKDLYYLGEEKATEAASALLKSKFLLKDEKWQESLAILTNWQNQYPKEAIFLWHLAYFYIEAGSFLDSNDSNRMKEIETGLAFAQTCIDEHPENGDCWLSYADISAEKALSLGTAFQMFSIDKVQKALEKAYELSKAHPFPYGIKRDSLGHASYALVQFYRIIPDSVLFWVVTGRRGEKQKSYDLAKALRNDPNNDNATAFLIFAKAALCWGGTIQNPSIITEAREAILEGLKKEPMSTQDETSNRDLIQVHHKLGDIKNDSDYAKIRQVGCF